MFVNIQVQQDYKAVKEEEEREKQREAKPFLEAISQFCLNFQLGNQEVYFRQTDIFGDDDKHIFQAMSELATLALPRPLLITFTNGAQADFVKARRILISNTFINFICLICLINICLLEHEKFTLQKQAEFFYEIQKYVSYLNASLYILGLICLMCL